MSNRPGELTDVRNRDLSALRNLEWMVSNGRGGFAMACVNQMLTRRYHGLLVAAVNPPTERYVLLAKLEVTARVGGLTYELGTNDYPEAVHPQGYRWLESFSLRPVPTWRWHAGSAIIEQTLCMARDEDTTFVHFRLVDGAESVQLSVRPLCTSRHFHHLGHANEIGAPAVDIHGETLSLQWPDQRPQWSLCHNGTFTSRPDWYYQFVLKTEAQRGYDSLQDLFMPGVIRATLSSGDDHGLVLVASTQGRTWQRWRSAFDEAARHDAALEGQIAKSDVLTTALVRAADDFLATRDVDGRTVIAGYPWFADWGRDTFISLPGLCMVTRRFDDARRILKAFGAYVKHGMIPNLFPNYGHAPAYNTADGTLWYVHAMDRYLAYSGDDEFIIEEMWPVVCEILDAHERGTLHGIRADDDGLLVQGEAGHGLTWMDARLPDRVVTPRIGKAVEICALWHNALCIGAEFAQRVGDPQRAKHWRELAAKARKSFNDRFWNASKGCLFDVVDVDREAGKCDALIRPNQLLAISLTHPILSHERWASVVEVCERELLTPMGLRTLAPGEPGYCEHYAGELAQRDAAYHQGTVWPWLLGPFVSAYVRAHKESADARSTARRFFDGLLAHLAEAGIGSVSEVADAVAPHSPGGCPWQAWSVAEPLRAWQEDILGNGPRTAASDNRIGVTAARTDPKNPKATTPAA